MSSCDMHYRITIACPDDRGLLAAVAGRLFELGGDLGDASFSLLGEEAQMSCVCTVPDEVTEATLEEALRALPATREGDVTVRPFRLGRTHTTSGRATHVIRVHGVDRPGLMASLAEGFTESGANVARMDAEQLERDTGRDYVMRFEVWIPPGRESACLAHAANTAESLGMTFAAERATQE